MKKNIIIKFIFNKRIKLNIRNVAAVHRPTKTLLFLPPFARSLRR